MTFLVFLKKKEQCDISSRDISHVGIASLLLDPEAAHLKKVSFCTVFMGAI